MELIVRRADDTVTHLVLSGRLDIAGVNLIGDRFTFTTTGRRKGTLLDLSGVTFIASLGIGLILGAAKALQRQGVKMVLLSPSGLVEQSLRAAGIDQVITIAHEEERALELLC